jgi:hypothetical protein
MSVPDEEASMVPKKITKPRRRCAIATEDLFHVQEQPPIVINDTKMFVFAGLVFGGRFTQQEQGFARLDISVLWSTTAFHRSFLHARL